MTDSITPCILLGVDPGLNRTGYAVLEHHPAGPVLREGGVIRSTAKRPLAERVGEISGGLEEVMRQYSPTVMAIEQVFSHAQYPRAAILMAHARGAILDLANRMGLSIANYAPREIKRLLTGSGAANKEQVQRAVSQELGLDHLLEPNDVADAFAVALCHYHQRRNQYLQLWK